MAIPYSRTIVGGLPWYSVLVVCGIALAIWLAEREGKRLGLMKDTAVDLALMVVPFGIVGARLYYVAMSWEQFAARPLSALYIWEGGLAIYGGVIGGALGAWIYAKRRKLSFAVLADIIAPGLILAQAIGRWGNYFNMEAYGQRIADETFMFFPFGVLIEHGGGYAWHMATFFYESMWNLAGFAFLWSVRKRMRFQGDLFAWYLVLYGSGRFIIEQLRQDSLYIGTLRASQWLSMALVLAASAVLIWRCAKRKRHFVLGLICASWWIARWFALGQTAWYGLLILVPALGAIWLLRNQKSLCLLVGMIGLDALGLLLSMQKIALGDGVHAAVCSLTLVGMLWALYLRRD